MEQDGSVEMEKEALDVEDEGHDGQGKEGNEKVAAGFGETDKDNFDVDAFALMMQEDVIAYKLSWDPLMKILQTLGASMARQQKMQQSNKLAMKKMEDEVATLREELARAEEEKKEAMEAIQSQVGEMQSQLEEGQGQTRVDGIEEQKGMETGLQETSSVEGKHDEDDTSLAAKQSPRANSIGRQPFVTANELDDAKNELRDELRNALERAFDRNVIDQGGENGDKAKGLEASPLHDYSVKNTADDSISSVIDTPSDNVPVTSRSSGEADRFQGSALPLATASDLQQEVAKLEGLQNALNARMADHDHLLDTLNERVGKLNKLSMEWPNLGTNSVISLQEVKSTDESIGKDNGGSIVHSKKHDEFATSVSDIVNKLKELKAVQDKHDNKLQEHDKTVQKHTVDIVALIESLDDMRVHQQTMNLMYAPSSSTSEESVPGSDNALAAVPETSGRNVKADDRVVPLPHLDLSLVFTKLTDLRRSMDASLNSLQETIKDVASTTQSQQEQLDALRNNVACNESLHTNLVEARLAMQKEVLARNQTYQDRTKPQLAEWREVLESTEEKLFQGNSEEETLYALQRIQRCYHQTILSLGSLVHSPLRIAETLQALADEVKQLQKAVQLGVAPLKDSTNANGAAGGETNHGEEASARKLQYLEEEIDATLQVNITTGKKTDMLIKGLEVIREKLELQWSMWHRNYSADRGQSSEAVILYEDPSTSAGGDTESRVSNQVRQAASVHVDASPGAGAETRVVNEVRHQNHQQRNPDNLREMELRLSGAVRRLGKVEEDIERLNDLTAELGAFDRRGSHLSAVSLDRRSPSTNNLRTELVMEEIEKLRHDVFAEIENLTGQFSKELQNEGNSTSSLIPGSRRSMVEAAVKQGDVLTDLYTQMTGRELDPRQYNSPEGSKEFYDNFMKEVTRNVSSLMSSEKGGQRVSGIGGVTSANVNYRLLLDNFAQKVDDRLEDAREHTTEELAKLRREVMEQLKIRLEVAIRDIRGELMLFQPLDGDSTAVGTKPVMCVACSRPVPVSSAIHEAGSLAADMTNAEITNSSLGAEYDYEQPNDDFVFRAGFKMPANDRKIVTLPFLTTAMRNKMVLNKPAGKRKRPPRQSHHSRVDNVVREARQRLGQWRRWQHFYSALELDRVTGQGRGFEPLS